MRWSPLILILFIVSCKSTPESEKLHNTLTGNWLIVYPDHQLDDALQKEAYSHVQDSIVELMGLKLITLSANGAFRQMDSLDHTGKWVISPEKIVYIEKGGKGFENYTAKYTDYKEKMLQLTESVRIDGQEIKLVWNLKKITGSQAELFSPQRNEWRRRPTQPETGKQMKGRLTDMLHYYSEYDKLVAKESSYFVLSRVALPFRFYQHAMGMKSFEEESFFTSLFYDKEQARQAYEYLSSTLEALQNDFPSYGNNYVVEYAEFMEQMADKIRE